MVLPAHRETARQPVRRRRGRPSVKEGAPLAAGTVVSVIAKG